MNEFARSLVFLSDVRYGGWVTFSWHLAQLLHRSSVLRIAPSMRGGGQFYDRTRYINITWRMMSRLPEPIVLAVGKAYRKHLADLQPGYIVIHDPTEICDEVLDYARRSTAIVIRPLVGELLSEHGITSLCLRHPFYRYARHAGSERRDRALSRIDWDKNTKMILEANAAGADIQVHGHCNRIYQHHGGLDELGFQEYYHGPYGRSMADISRLYSSTRNLVDMSVIKRDGGGTQYTFLEAEYHGCGLVLHRDWANVPGSIYEHGINCRIAGTAQELAAQLQLEPILPDALPTDAMNRKWVDALGRKTA